MRRKIGLVVRYSYNGSYRFCYSSRGTPGGSTPSLLLLHGFSASKDMWLTLVPVSHPLQTQPLVPNCKPGINFTFLALFLSSHHSLLSTSFSLKASMLSVWTCRVTRGRAAPGQRTTASRVRSTESTRSVSVRRREPFRPSYCTTCGVRVKVHPLRPFLPCLDLWSLVMTRSCLLLEEQHGMIFLLEMFCHTVFVVVQPDNWSVIVDLNIRLFSILCTCV